MLKNEWNNKITGVEAIATVPEFEIREDDFRDSMMMNSPGLFKFYFEIPEDAELRDYQGSVSIVHDQLSNREAVVVPFTITVLDPADDPEAAAKQTVEERPGFSLALTPLTGLYLIVFLLVVVNLMLILRQTKRK
jgi:hypothetical protein